MYGLKSNKPFYKRIIMNQFNRNMTPALNTAPVLVLIGSHTVSTAIINIAAHTVCMHPPTKNLTPTNIR